MKCDWSIRCDQQPHHLADLITCRRHLLSYRESRMVWWGQQQFIVNCILYKPVNQKRDASSVRMKGRNGEMSIKWIDLPSATSHENVTHIDLPSGKQAAIDVSDLLQLPHKSEWRKLSQHLKKHSTARYAFSLHFKEDQTRDTEEKW